MSRHLVIIDPQRDFCKPDGALYVPGADDDMKRLASIVSPDRFDAIHVTLDSHQWVHIAHPIFWEDANGASPGPFAAIHVADVEGGIWRARSPELRDYALHYVRELEAKGRYRLTIWPPHCVIGTKGHAIHDELGESLRDWANAGLETIDYVAKGSNARTEHYSAIQADVPDPSDPSTATNRRFVQALEGVDELVFAGEALDYCLLNTVRDLVVASPGLTSRIVVLSDASSSIGGCSIHDHEFFQDLVGKGARLATTADL